MIEKLSIYKLLLIALISLFFMLILRTDKGSCQILGNSYVWQDTVGISGIAKDSTFAKKWEYIECWTDSVDWYAIIGASASGIDTAGFVSRKPILIRAGDVLIIGPELKLRRLRFWSRSGSGTLNFLGEKKTKH